MGALQEAVGGKEQLCPGGPSGQAQSTSQAGLPHTAPSLWPAALSLGGPPLAPLLPWAWLWSDPSCPQPSLPWTSGCIVGGAPLSRLTALKEETPGDEAVGGEREEGGQERWPSPARPGICSGGKVGGCLAPSNKKNWN